MINKGHKNFICLLLYLMLVQFDKNLSEIMLPGQLIFKITTNIVCIIGLVYQTSILFGQYMRGNTVVHIEVYRIENTSLPAITICYPHILSFERLAKNQQEYNASFEQYKNLLKRIDKEKNNTIKMNLFGDMLEIYFSVVQRVEISLHQPNNLMNLFVNYSLGYQSDNEERKKYGFKKSEIDVILTGSFTNDTNHGVMQVNEKNLFLFKGDKIISYFIKSQILGYKCYTLFSSLIDYWRNFQAVLKRIMINMHHNSFWYPIFPNDMYNRTPR